MTRYSYILQFHPNHEVGTRTKWERGLLYMRKLHLLAVAAILLLVVTHSDALVKFDFEQKFLVEFGLEVKDHCLIRVDGLYHVFYLRGPIGENAVDVGHATSPDLVHWELLDPVLPVEPGTWDARAIWAPQIIQLPSGMYLMYYTGLNRVLSQQTGIAYSFDLYNWEKIPWPVYHPDPSWALWSEEAWANGRDPFVFEHDGLYYQLLTASTLANRGAIACAVSNDYYNWQDIGPLHIHENWHVLESVQCFEHNDFWYLFFTEEQVNGTSYMMSDSLFGDWDGTTATLIDFGHAPEINEFDEGSYVYSRHSVHQYGDGNSQHFIRFDSLRWSGPSPYVYRPWPLNGEWNLVWGNAFLFQPTFLNNPEVRGETVDVGFEGICWLSSYERYQGPLGIGSPGGYQGDSPTGVIRSKTFTIMGNSMSLLVAGGDYPDQCYVALVDAGTNEVLYKETGRNTDELDRRAWNLKPYRGRQVFIEIADNSSAAFGHISCDDIIESNEVIETDSLSGTKGKKQLAFASGDDLMRPSPQLLQNTPNPFNPGTTVPYFLPSDGYVTLAVFNVHGKQVRRLRDQKDTQGIHYVTWDAKNDRGGAVTSGIYFYRLCVDGRTIATRKMILVK